MFISVKAKNVCFWHVEIITIVKYARQDGYKSFRANN